MRFNDITGQKFGRLTVVGRAENNGKKTMWLCRCECGNTKVVEGGNLKTGHVRSCGCLWNDTVPEHNKELNTRHGESHSKLHRAWTNMRYRCYNPKCKSYQNYGGRGITICEEWSSYEAFRDWALANGFAYGLSIDRIDVNGNYEPSNCRWVSTEIQQNNLRTNRRIAYDGEEHTVAEWATITGIKWTTLKERLNRGWTIEEALTKEVR